MVRRVALSLCVGAITAVICGLLLLRYGVRPPSLAGKESGWPTLEGRLPAGSLFVEHLGGFCFGRHRVESDLVVGQITVEVQAPGVGPWMGRGSLYILVYDDEPRHWGLAQSMWRADSWHELVQAASWCGELLAFTGSDGRHLSEAGGRNASSAAVLRWKVNIRERFTRQWRIALLGLDGWELAPELAKAARYRVTGAHALSGWTGGERSGPPSGQCPALHWEAVKERLYDFLAPGSLPGPTAPPPRPALMVMRPGLHHCHSALAQRW